MLLRSDYLPTRRQLLWEVLKLENCQSWAYAVCRVSLVCILILMSCTMQQFIGKPCRIITSKISSCGRTIKFIILYFWWACETCVGQKYKIINLYKIYNQISILQILLPKHTFWTSQWWSLVISFTFYITLNFQIPIFKYTLPELSFHKVMQTTPKNSIIWCFTECRQLRQSASTLGVTFFMRNQPQKSTSHKYNVITSTIHNIKCITSNA